MSMTQRIVRNLILSMAIFHYGTALLMTLALAS